MAQYTILFVDDEERVLRSLKSLFRRDYIVLVANSGQAALKILSERSVNVVISDQRMPTMLGNELLARIKQLYPDIMRLLLTGYMDKEAIIKTINEGEIYRFINKPWQVNDIKHTIAEAAKASVLTINEPALKVKEPLSQPSVNSKRTYQYNSVSNTLSKTHKVEETSPHYKKSQPPIDLPKRSVLYARRTKQQLITNSELNNEPDTHSKRLRERRNPASVLLMDPDQNIRNQVRRLSYDRGFQVYGHQRLEQAVRTLALRPNIGVAIFGMPLDARQTIEAIHLLKLNRPELSIITLAETTDANVAVELINTGQVFRYLQKPLKDATFDNMIAEAMARHHTMLNNSHLQARYNVVKIRRAESSSFERFKSFFKMNVA